MWSEQHRPGLDSAIALAGPHLFVFAFNIIVSSYDVDHMLLYEFCNNRNNNKCVLVLSYQSTLNYFTSLNCYK